MIAGIWERNAELYPSVLNFVLENVNSANEDTPGTLSGLIVTSDYSSFHVALKSLTINTRNHSKIGTLDVGTRVDNCLEMMEDERKYLGLLQSLNFVICTIFPSKFLTPKESADNIGQQMIQMLDKLNNLRLNLTVHLQTRWPSEQTTKENLQGSVENMNRFWCRINERSEQNKVKIDLFTAFDEPWKDITRKETTESHYGWWIRIREDTSTTADFEEKIFHKYGYLHFYNHLF